MQNKDLVIINNEKIFIEKESFYCDNLDLKILPEELNSYYQVQYIVRSSKRKGNQKINLRNIKITSFFNLFYYIFKTFKKKEVKYLLISVTPFTFLAFLILFLFRRKAFIYLFSNGYEEYKHILGSNFVWVYNIMFKMMTSRNEVIVCHDRLYNKKKSHLVYISRLDEEWLNNQRKVLLDKVRFLYVGRMSAEKGIFEFLKMFDQLKFDAQLSIVGDVEKYNFSTNKQNISLLGYVADSKSLIQVYDDHNIMILPSFTEGTPYVVDESLSRKRPVIIFEDIKYIIRDKIGIFVSKRDIDSLSEVTKYVMDNYTEIQKNMEKNTLPTKKSMIKEIANIIELQNS
tara:strand:+ start:26366 stop:27394 length:1029 start_codon:yes stop_codon:yes gene_type:complete